MIARWMLYGLAVTTLLAVAGMLVERVATVLYWPRRIGWAAALLVAMIGTAVVPLRGGQAPAPPAVAAAAFEPAALRTELHASFPVPSSPWSPTVLLERGQALVTDLVARARPVEPLLRLGWLLGALLLALTYSLGVMVLARRRRAWVPRRVDGVDVLVARRDGPAVLGLLHPRIVLPEWALALDAPSRALMIRHECEHLRARDPILLHAASLAVIVMPWNAAAWWIVYRLRLAIELDCDARVLRGVATVAADASRYGQLLLDVATHRSPGSIRIAPAMLEHTSSLSRRIAAMYPDRLRFPRMQSALAAAGSVCLLALTAQMPVPTLSAQEPSMERLVGAATAAPAPMLSIGSTRELLQKYYPDVLRGEGPRSVAFVRDLSGRVIGTMPVSDAEMLVGDIRGFEQRLEEPSLEPRRNVAMMREEPVRREAVTLSTQGYAVIQERTLIEVVDALQQQLEEAQRAASAHPSSEYEARIKLLESQLREQQARLDRFRGGERMGVGYEIPTGCGGDSDAARACRDRSRAEQDSARVQEQALRNLRQARDLKGADSVLRERVQQLDSVRAEVRVRRPTDPEEAMSVDRPVERGLGAEYQSLKAHTVAVDVVRHASGLFGREPVNIFFVTRNGPN